MSTSSKTECTNSRHQLLLTFRCWRGIEPATGLLHLIHPLQHHQLRSDHFYADETFSAYLRKKLQIFLEEKLSRKWFAGLGWFIQRSGAF